MYFTMSVLILDFVKVILVPMKLKIIIFIYITVVSYLYIERKIKC